MAKMDSTDIPSIYMNPSYYSGVKDEKKTKNVKRGRNVDFSHLLDDLRGRTADDIGPLIDLPVSEESINYLMDEVRNAGDILKSRPYPDEIMRYKQTVRNFLNYVVQNSYAIEQDEGIANKFRPGFKGKRSAPAADNKKLYTKIRIVDKRLDDLAAMLITSQLPQMEIVSRLEEIRGLLVDLLQ